MDVWEKPLREDPYRNRRESPSFSSTLLDAIYRSIDESNGGSKAEEELIFYRETMKKKHASALKGDEEMAGLRRACIIEKWMEKKASCHEKVVVGRRKSMADFDGRKALKESDSVFMNLSSSSSESSTGGFSSSESDSFYAARSRSSPSRYGTAQRPKPIRTSMSAMPDQRLFDRSQVDVMDAYGRAPPKKLEHKHEGGFVRTKSKALKIYSDLKKVKQPISPGGRLASFLNSLFTAGNPKKAKISSSGYDERKLQKSEQASTCSSASSFSRSCLSKTPSSRGKSNSTNKRSVRFCPVSVIVDEDCRPCGHKSLHNEKEQSTIRNPTNEKLDHLRVMEENRRVVQAAKDLLKNYQKKKEEFNMRDVSNHENEVSYEDDAEDEEDDDDAASYASSDLFELDNLSAVGIDRYREELPVYETTNLGTNRAIANGLIL